MRHSARSTCVYGDVGAKEKQQARRGRQRRRPRRTSTKEISCSSSSLASPLSLWPVRRFNCACVCSARRRKCPSSSRALRAPCPLARGAASIPPHPHSKGASVAAARQRASRTIKLLPSDRRGLPLLASLASVHDQLRSPGARWEGCCLGTRRGAQCCAASGPTDGRRQSVPPTRARFPSCAHLRAARAPPSFSTRRGDGAAAVQHPAAAAPMLAWVKGGASPAPAPRSTALGTPGRSASSTSLGAASSGAATPNPTAPPRTPESGGASYGRPRSDSATPSASEDALSLASGATGTSFSSAADVAYFAPASTEDAVHAVPSLLSLLLSGRTDEQVRPWVAWGGGGTCCWDMLLGGLLGCLGSAASLATACRYRSAHEHAPPLIPSC